MGDVSCFTVQFILSVCGLEASRFHIALVCAENRAQIFPVSSEKINTFGDERENSLLVSNPLLHREAQTLNRRNKKKHKCFTRGGL